MFAKDLQQAGVISFECYTAIDQLMLAYTLAKKGSKRYTAFDLNSRLEDYWKKCAGI